MNGTMIEAKAPTGSVRRVYDLWSHFYGWAVAPMERKARALGLERAAIGPGDRVLEVAVGPGNTYVEILRRAGAEHAVGVDLSQRMLQVARRRARRAGFAQVRLEEADARRLPFADGTFDVVYSSYMLDLIPLADLPVVLAEMRRVLGPGGRLVLVSMSKPEDRGATTPWEKLYLALPERWAPYVTGGCRPVLLRPLVERAGFAGVRRESVGGWLHSEVVDARKPAEAKGLS